MLVLSDERQRQALFVAVAAVLDRGKVVEAMRMAGPPTEFMSIC